MGKRFIEPYVRAQAVALYQSGLNLSKTSRQLCNDKKMEHVDFMMMFIDKLEGAAYRHPR